MCRGITFLLALLLFWFFNGVRCAECGTIRPPAPRPAGDRLHRPCCCSRCASFRGQQYRNESGYDPVAFLDFFEPMSQRERSEKKSIAKAFASHPMTEECIMAAEHTVEEILSRRDDYIVTTWRHDQVRVYLENLLEERAPGRSSGSDVAPTGSAGGSAGEKDQRLTILG